ncbi:hypothetical protein BV372_12100 [Nostoc sp. T09]|uniref:NACHT domain-containing protein n=1 Tax=Nostoc sp. T09 TaxID=1932621 RepID=UPI000A394CC4|nr:NACHT domain-containing protein [Nostoc sp. T09]OUL35092.1 hypothetical protein BV372_12100 [Nostoc sp. T09]
MTAKVARHKINLLYNNESINLPMEEQPDQVRPLGDEDYKGSYRHKRKLPEDVNIVTVFDRADIAGWLLILGEPGSGKTTTLMQLASELIIRAKGDSSYPIPAYFELSSWKGSKERKADKQYEKSFLKWLLNELNRIYGVAVETGLQWIKNQKLLLLLDGLDEMQPLNQQRCVKAINIFIQGEYKPKHLVVCSRRLAYEKIDFSSKLHLNGAVYLQPLQQIQIEKYLIKVGCQEIVDIIGQSTQLLNLIKNSPLMLSFLISIYIVQEIAITKYKNFNSELEISRALFRDYVSQKLKFLVEEINSESPGQQLTEEKAKYMLIWLAKRLTQDSNIYFSIEDMQPTWLQDRSERLKYGIAVGLMVGLIIGLLSGLVQGLRSILHHSVLGIVFGALIGALIISFREISPVEVFKWPTMKSREQSWKDGLRCVGLSEGIIFGTISNVTNIDTRNNYQMNLLFKLEHFKALLMNGLVGGLVGIPLGAFVRQLGGSDNIDNKLSINEGIKRSAKFAIIFAIVFGLFLGLTGWLIGLIIKPSLCLKFAKFFGLAGVLIGGFVPGIACIQHFVLRIILFHDEYIPWNYGYFLEHTRQKQLMERVGGSYRFIYPLLQKYFAELQLIKRW